MFPKKYAKDKQDEILVCNATDKSIDCVEKGTRSTFKGLKCKHCYNMLQRTQFKKYYQANKAKWYKGKELPTSTRKRVNIETKRLVEKEL